MYAVLALFQKMITQQLQKPTFVEQTASIPQKQPNHHPTVLALSRQMVSSTLRYQSRSMIGQLALLFLLIIFTQLFNETWGSGTIAHNALLPRVIQCPDNARDETQGPQFTYACSLQLDLCPHLCRSSNWKLCICTLKIRARAKVALINLLIIS